MGYDSRIWSVLFWIVSPLLPAIAAFSPEDLGMSPVGYKWTIILLGMLSGLFGKLGASWISKSDDGMTVKASTLEKLAPILLLALLLPSVAAAQTVVTNPLLVTFDYSAWRTAAEYQGAYFQLLVKPDGTCDTVTVPSPDPTTTDTLTPSAPSSGINLTASMSAKPIGCYAYKVRARDVSGLWSLWSDVSNPFATPPPTVTNVTVRK